MRRTVSTPVSCVSVCVVLATFALLHATPVSSSCLFSRFSIRVADESRVQSCLPGAGREVFRLLDSGVHASAPPRRLQPRDARLSRAFLTLPSSSSGILSSSLSPQVSSSRKRLLPAAWPSVLRVCMRAVSWTRASEGQPLLPLPFSTLIRLHFLTTLLSFTALGFNAFLSSRHLVLLPSLPRACLQLLNGNNQLHVFLRGVCTPDLPALQATVSGPFFEEFQFRFLLQKCLLSPLLAAVGSSWLSVAAGPRSRRLSSVKLEDGETTVRRGDVQGASSSSDATASSKEKAESTQPEARNRTFDSVDGSSLREKLARVLRSARLVETRERSFRDAFGANSSEKHVDAGCRQQRLQERREASSPRCRVEQTLRIAITSILFALAHYVPPSVASPVRREFRRAVVKQRTRLGFPLKPSGAKPFFPMVSESSFSSPSVKQLSPLSAAARSAPSAARSAASTLAEEELPSVDSPRRRVEECVAANRILTAAVQGCVWSYAAERGGFASALLLHVLHNLQQFIFLAAFRTVVRRRQERQRRAFERESRL
ncbi:UNVERIFIED_CONTAM: hypothetical protein HHA_280720 [Hammondia hammondi]|eukprot:XP_008885933.1 hypothetical protein HHA_280720 [Hammondia hammondi]